MPSYVQTDSQIASSPQNNVGRGRGQGGDGERGILSRASFLQEK